MNAAGLNLLKLDHVRNSALSTERQRNECGRPMWHIGLYLYIASQLAGSTIALSKFLLLKWSFMSGDWLFSLSLCSCVSVNGCLCVSVNGCLCAWMFLCSVQFELFFLFVRQANNSDSNSSRLSSPITPNNSTMSTIAIHHTTIDIEPCLFRHTAPWLDTLYRLKPDTTTKSMNILSPLHHITLLFILQVGEDPLLFHFLIFLSIDPNTSSLTRELHVKN